MSDVDKLAGDLALVQLAEWIAIEHDETRLQFGRYVEEAQGLADLLYVLGYRLIDTKPVMSDLLLTEEQVGLIEWESGTLDMSFVDDYPAEIKALLQAQVAFMQIPKDGKVWKKVNVPGKEK